MKNIGWFAISVIPCILLYYFASEYFAAKKYFENSKLHQPPDFIVQGDMFIKGQTAVSNAIFFFIVADILLSIILKYNGGIWAILGWNIPLALSLFFAYRCGSARIQPTAIDFLSQAQDVDSAQVGADTFYGTYTSDKKILAIMRVERILIKPLCIVNRAAGSTLAAAILLLAHLVYVLA